MQEPRQAGLGRAVEARAVLDRQRAGELQHVVLPIALAAAMRRAPPLAGRVGVELVAVGAQHGPHVAEARGRASSGCPAATRPERAGNAPCPSSPAGRQCARPSPAEVSQRGAVAASARWARCSRHTSQGAAFEGQRGPEADDTGPDEDVPQRRGNRSCRDASNALAEQAQAVFPLIANHSFSPELPSVEFHLQRLMQG